MTTGNRTFTTAHRNVKIARKMGEFKSERVYKISIEKLKISASVDLPPDINTMKVNQILLFLIHRT